jgi:hypothetical protein
MANFRRPEELLCCSFCGKSQNDVRKLIAGPGVYVCNECIDICNEIINDDEQTETSSARATIPKPQEIKGFLDEYVIGQDEPKRGFRSPCTSTISGLKWPNGVQMSRFRNPTFFSSARPVPKDAACANTGACT